MAHRNSFMEWMEQTKRFSKSVDYICMETIDSIIRVSPYLRIMDLRRHADFFDYYCDYYHKPHPLKLMRRRKSAVPCKHCEDRAGVMGAFADYVDSSIRRCYQGQEAVTWQIFECIDFMFERPELVNPNSIDDYMSLMIGRVCKDHKKNNPLNTPIVKKFGRYWRDDNGRWRKERRNRF